MQIVVADSGVGMSEEETARVFERFYRGADGARAAAARASACRSSSRWSSCTRARSTSSPSPAGGTTFRVLLPAAVPGAESGRSLEAIRGRRVLVVDDEREVAELIAGQLAPLEVQTTIATSGQRGPGAAAQRRATTRSRSTS